MLRRWLRDIGNLAGFSLAIILSFFVIAGGLNAPRVSAALAEAMRGSFPIAFCIGGISWLVMPKIAARVGNRPALVRWPIYVAGMTCTATAGTMLAGAFYYIGFASARSTPYWRLVGEALKSSIPITWVVGSVVTIMGTVTSRLQATELALRTQQLERERAEKLAAEAQLASLASRVQPHFLFNTLNSISEMVRQDPAQAEVLIERLSSLLRSSLDGAETVPLEQELKLVADYLEIQQVRFAGRLRYQLDPPPADSPRVPPFSVQTLVENSLQHVAGKRVEGVAIQVRQRKIGEAWVVDVTDNGPGFAADSISAGHGLDNLKGRLRAVYGGAARIEFLREPEAMTVRLRVPA